MTNDAVSNILGSMDFSSHVASFDWTGSWRTTTAAAATTTATTKRPIPSSTGRDDPADGRLWDPS